jgi:hypothetical protein
MRIQIWIEYVKDVFIKTWLATALAGALAGILFFVSFFGLHAINPSNVDWLLNNNDLEQHYTGWVFFRESHWQLPLGMIDGLAYPFGIPITFIDSIPLFALFFKLLSPILPTTFQYFGLWGLMCFALQGALGALIVRRFMRNILVTTIGSLLFVITPVFIGRMFIHTALAANWLILAGILTLLYFRRIQNKGVRFEVGLWSILMTLVVLIHPYYLPMVGVFFVSYIALAHKQILRTALLVATPLVSMLLVFWLIGGFSLKGDSGAGGLDTYGFNLISPINPLGWSDILASRPIGVTSGETQNYLGLGVIIGGILFFSSLVTRGLNKSSLMTVLKNKRVWIVAGLFIGLFVLSLGTIVRYQAHILLDLRDLPQRILEKWATFRSSGRLFWPIYYLMITGVIAGVLTTFRKSKNVVGAVIVIVVMVGLQYIDIVKSPVGSSRHLLTDSNVEKSPTERQVLLYANEKKFDTKTIKEHLVYVDSMTPQDFFNLNEFAIQEGLTMNTGYFSRSPKTNIDRLISESRGQIARGVDIDDTTLFVAHQTSLGDLRVPKNVYITDRVAEYVFIYEK